jgi:restriction endonuclease S subunit
MSLDRLLSQFDALAEHGTNIARIRKLLIINVIKRSISREGFLQRAATAKAQIALTSQNSGGKTPKTRNQDLALPDVLLKIPAEAFGRLGDIAEIEKGLTAIQKSKPGPYPLVVTAETRSSNETFDFEGPAVVIPMVSSTGHGHASLKRIHYQEGKFAAGNILSVVKPKLPELLNTRFLYEYLTAFKEELLVARMVGTANVSLTINGLRDIPVPLIQGEDVAKVDELMALCDRLEAQLKDRDFKQAALAKAALAKFTEEPTPENLQLLFNPSFSIEPEDLKKLILNLAIKGKLTAQNPADEPAHRLLERIVAHNTVGKRGKFTPAITDSSTKGTADIPDGWIWARFGEIVVNRDGERIPVSKEIRETKAKIYDYYGASGVIDKIDSFIFSEPLLLIGEDGANLINRSTPIAFIARGQYWVNNHAHVLGGISEDLLKYLEIYINAINLEAYVTGSAQPKMNQAKLNSIPIALPPMNEQQRIAVKVAELQRLVDQLEAQLEASRTTGEKLLEAMVAELTAA